MKKIIYFLSVIIISPITLLSQVSQQWGANYYNQPLGSNFASSVAVDNSGNIYVAAQSDSIPNSTDFTTIKYNSSGIMQWIRRYDGPIHGSDGPSSIKTDASGNIYVSGSSEGPDTTYDFATVKYNSNGVQQWVARYSAPNETDILNKMVIDNSGNVYVTGISYNDTTLTDIVTIKYNSNGVQQWLARYNSGMDEFTPFIKVSSSGNVYVAGTTVDSVSNEDYLLLKYSSSGIQQWVRSYNSASSNFDNPVNLELDASENIIVAGTTNTYGLQDFTTLKYNSSGVLQWSKVYSDSSDYARDITVDASGNVYITGMVYYSNSFFSF